MNVAGGNRSKFLMFQSNKNIQGKHNKIFWESFAIKPFIFRYYGISAAAHAAY